MKQEGMTFDHDFCYIILLFSSLQRSTREFTSKFPITFLSKKKYILLETFFMQFVRPKISDKDVFEKRQKSILLLY